MASKQRTDAELWESLRQLNDDMFDPAMPEAMVDAELTAMGIDPEALAQRGLAFVEQVKKTLPAKGG